MDILSHPFEFGLEDAQDKKACVPEMYFYKAADCAEYALGYISHSPTPDARQVLNYYGSLEQRLQAQIATNERILASTAALLEEQGYRAFCMGLPEASCTEPAQRGGWQQAAADAQAVHEESIFKPFLVDA